MRLSLIEERKARAAETRQREEVIRQELEANARAAETRQREEVIRQELEAKAQAKRDREEARRQAALSASEVVGEILARMPRESAEAYVSRVDRAMRRLGYHHDAWYARGAELFDMTERDFYSLIMSPKVGR